MTTRRSLSETAGWLAIALAGGSVVGWVDASASEVQGSVLLLMLLNFALTLPGRAPVILTAIASAAGLPLVYALRLHAFNAGMLIAIVPALIAGGGGALVGRFLDLATTGLTESAEDSAEVPWHARPLPLRFVLGSALVGLSVAGTWSVHTALVALGHPVPGFVAMVWETMTLVGWTAVAPIILRAHSRESVPTGLTLADATLHVAIVLALCVVHTTLITTATAVLLIPVHPSWPDMARAAFESYLPLDAAAYLAILPIGYASDVERHRRAAAEREAALRTEAAENRLGALRSQLNPHFLFNALNSVDVLARSGRGEETSRLVGGITNLLRYVLDERRPVVPLSEELDFVREYLAVQRARFGERLEPIIHVVRDVELLFVPQLLLQPIVENAVEHGVARTLEGGAVSVTAERDRGMLRLIVENDGPPADASTSPSSASGGLGLANTQERLAKLFGASASVSVDARTTPRPGTRVVLRLPIVESTVPA
jgi:two-component system, LytTR family, sensor kinase